MSRPPGWMPSSTELVLLALHELMKGKATIIISHDLNLIRQRRQDHRDRPGPDRAGGHA